MMESKIVKVGSNVRDASIYHAIANTLFFCNLQTIDKQTDITYQVSAPSGGGLVGSRDFVNLRCWQLVQNGQLTTDTNSAKLDHCDDDDKFYDNASLNPIRKTTSEMQLHQHTDDNIMDQSITSLSKSLGAKVLAEDTSANEFFQSLSSTGVDCDPPAHETILTVDESVQQDSVDEMYILSGVSITYDRMPTSAKYIRLVCVMDI